MLNVSTLNALFCLELSCINLSLTQATKAIAVLCQVEEGKEITKDFFPKMFSVLVQRVGVSAYIEGDKKNENSASWLVEEKCCVILFTCGTTSIVL